MKRLLILVSIIGFLMASLLTPLRAQWQLAYNFPEGGGVEDLYFADTSYGWFVGSFTMNSTYYRNLYTSDGGYTFIPQASPTGSYNLYSIFFEDTLTGWSGGGPYNNGPGTVLNTTDGGANWSLVSHPAPKCAWNVITKGGNILLFGGGYSANGGGGILMKTTDGGVSWTFTQYPIASGYGGISTLVAFDESNYVVGGNKGFLARTTDGGVTWIEANLNIDFQVEEISFVNQNLGYAIITDIANWDDYLYITTNGGYTWFEHYSWIGGGQKQALSVIPNTDIIFVGGYLDGAGNSYGILKSVDGGFTWNVVYHEPVTGGPPLAIQTPDIQHGWAVNGKVLRYDYVEPPVVQPIPNALIQMGAPFQYQVQATGTGLKYTMSGQPQGLNIGLYSGLIQGAPSEGGNFPITVAVKDTDANVVNAQFNLRVNRSPVFIPPFPSTHAWVDSVYQFTLSVEDADDDTVDFVWLTKPDWLTFLTAGITSVVISGVPTINDTGNTDISVMASDDYGGQGTLFWTLRVELYVPGNNAPYFIPPWPDTLAYVDSVYDAILYAEDIDGDSLFFSFLQNPAWLLMLIEGQTTRLQGAPEVNDTGYNQVSVMVDDNRGGSGTLNWTIHVLYSPPPVNNLPQFVGSWPDTVTVYRDSAYTWDFLFQDIDGDTLFVQAGEIGVPGMELLPGSGVGEVTATVTGNPTDTGWYTALVSVRDEHGGQGQLQFTVHVDFVTGVEPGPGIPTEYSLAQNYPNPFNPLTTIEYSLPQASVVELKIYNLLGQEVEVLVNNEYQPIGVYEVSFDASILPSGIYFYRLQAGDYIKTNKMVLLK